MARPEMDEGAGELTPLGRLLEEARESIPLSKREAARLAAISEGRWRQIVTGKQKSGNVVIPVNPRKNTVIAMARAVGVDPVEAQRAAGFTPLAEPDRLGPTPPVVRKILATLSDPDVPERDKQYLLGQMELLDAQIDLIHERQARQRAGQEPPGPQRRPA